MKEKITFALIMGIITTGVITFSLISITLGFSGNFLVTWIKSWGIAYLIGVPVIMIAGPRVQSLVKILLKKSKNGN